MESLFINLTSSACTLNNVTSPYKYAEIYTGLYYDILNPITNGIMELNLNTYTGPPPCILDNQNPNLMV
jgi:hypothetical protein